jgi:dCMP deaminase
MNQHQIDKRYLDIAIRVSHDSYCKRLKVGSILVQFNGYTHRIISEGFNGTRRLIDENDCEDKNGITKPNVVHAEINALKKLITSNESSVGSTMYITHCPCYNCAVEIYNSGIKRVVYMNDFKSDEGAIFLAQNGITIEKFNPNV